MMTPQPPSYSNGMNNVNQYTRPNYTSAQPQNTNQQPPYPMQPIPGTTSTAPPMGHYQSQNYTRPVQPPNTGSQHTTYHNTNVMERTAEAYVLSSVANESIPRDLRERFPRDDLGRVLFFTQPPMSTEHVVSGSTDVEQGTPLRHTEKYEHAQALRKRKQRERHRDADTNLDADDDLTEKQFDSLADGGSIEADGLRAQVTANSMRLLNDQVVKGMLDHYKVMTGVNWDEVLKNDMIRGQERTQKDRERDRAMAEKRAKLSRPHSDRYAASNGKHTLNSEGYLNDWQKGFFSGRYLDDYDSRLPF